MPNNTPLDKLIKSVKNNIDSNHVVKYAPEYIFLVRLWILMALQVALIFRMHGLLDYSRNNMAMGSIDR